MQVTDQMLEAAMKKAVEVGLLSKMVYDEDAYLKNWVNMRSVLQAAFASAPPETKQ
jgi:hypothetical protein